AVEAMSAALQLIEQRVLPGAGRAGQDDEERRRRIARGGHPAGGGVRHASSPGWLPIASPRWVERCERTRPSMVSGVIAASMIVPLSMNTTAFVRRPLVMSIVMLLSRPSCTRRLTGAEPGAAMPTT